MIIRSTFEDYYDGQQAYGIDDQVVYERTLRQHVIDPKLIQHEELVAFLRREEDDYPGIGLIGVCGLGFPVSTSINAYRPDEQRSPGWLPSGSLFSAEYSYLWHSAQDISNGFPIGNTIFEHLNSPTFLTLAKIYQDDWITFSGIQLKAFGIQKVVTAFDAFVAIRNYLVNFLSPSGNSPTTVGDDKTIARQKGFDDQSFRQAAPGNKKVNRAANRLKKKGGR
ncbi:MAG: hypothetical protein JSS65_12190 [Armatimonadetes bacterium]|nr:hypothetical protein [Armatimonadota bacterium]